MNARSHAAIVPVEEFSRVNAVPRLSRLLKVSDVFVAKFEVSVSIVEGQAAVVASRTSVSAVYVAVGLRLVVRSVYHDMIGQQSGACFSTIDEGVVASSAEADFNRGLLFRQSGGEGDGSSEGSVAVGGSSHAALNFHIAQQGCIAVHIRPEHALVFRTIKTNAIKRDVDTASACTAQAHIGSSRTESVLAPCHDARRACKKEGQFPPTLGKL